MFDLAERAEPCDPEQSVRDPTENWAHQYVKGENYRSTGEGRPVERQGQERVLRHRLGRTDQIERYQNQYPCHSEEQCCYALIIDRETMRENEGDCGE